MICQRGVHCLKSRPPGGSQLRRPCNLYPSMRLQVLLTQEVTSVLQRLT